jgi:hypothetical protein
MPPSTIIRVKLTPFPMLSVSTKKTMVSCSSILITVMDVPTLSVVDVWSSVKSLQVRRRKEKKKWDFKI